MFLDAQCSCHFCLVVALFYPDQKHFQMVSFLCLYYAESILSIGFCYMLVDSDWSHVQTDSLSIIHSGMVNEQKYIYNIYIYIYIITWNIILLLFHQWKVKDPRVKLLLLNVWDCLWFHFIWELVFKRFFDPEMKILSSFTHPNVTRRNVFIFRTKMKIFFK